MENPRFRNYFLGRLEPAQVEALEFEIISSSEMETELQIAESNLIDDYLDETLSSDEKKAFELNYLITDERSKQVEIIKQLKIYSQKNLQPDLQPSFFEQLKTYLSWRPMMVATAGIVLILALGIGWSLYFTSSQNDAELIALNQKDLSNLEEFKEITSLSLVSLNLRSEGDLKNLNSNAISDRVLFRLALPAKIGSPQTLTITISRDGKVLHNFKQKTYQNQELRLLLPKSILNKGEYQITVENGPEKYNYFFVVR